MTKPTLSENDKTLLLVSLQNGIGLSSACEISMLDVQTVSRYLLENKEFYVSCIHAIKATAAGNLEFISKLKKEKKFNEWHRQQDRIKSFITEITLWECYCKRDEVDANKVMRAGHIYKTMEECATAIGMTKMEFVNYIIDNEALSMYFSQAGIYNF